MSIPNGFLISAINSGIKKDALDLGLLCANEYATAVGFFTTNKNVSYSVTQSKKVINNPIKAILVNSGNANCFSHANGLQDTQHLCESLASRLMVSTKNILIASTGIIGKKMPFDTIITALPKLTSSLSLDAKNFAQCIMTTDTFPKISTASFKSKQGLVTVTGFAKGAGMIAPNVATMLVFILTDAKLNKAQLKKCGKQAIEESFNAITVDGCMSTNDTVFLLSSNMVAVNAATEVSQFSKALNRVCLDLATLIVRDGEGATKFITIKIRGAATKSEAKKAGLAVANSNLFKCAVYGANPNWGRVVAAIGAAGIKVNEQVGVDLSDLTKKDVTVDVDLKRGKFASTIYTSDLTPEYVKINADYS